MLLLAASAAWTATIALLLARAVRQYQFYETLSSAAPNASSTDALKPALQTLAVIVPARNEAADLPRCLKTLQAQDYPGLQQMIVVNDHSTDDTAAVAKAAASEDARIRLIDAGPLPAGWAGKTNACVSGAGEAGDVQWLCFTDADTASDPTLLSCAIREARRRDLGLLSLGTLPELVGGWERLVVPSGFFLIALTQDVRATADPANPDAKVNGQFLLIRRDVYEATGGFAAVHVSASEDSALARAVKRAGYRIAMLGAEDLIRTRMYPDLPSLWEGLNRQSREITGSAWASLACAAAGLILGWAAPLLPAYALSAVLRRQSGSPGIALALALPGSLALLGTHLGIARRFRIPLIYGLSFPLSYTVGAAILVNAALQQRTGRLRWKGRTLITAAHRGDMTDVKLTQGSGD